MAEDKIKLTKLSARCGCAGKFTPESLAKVLEHIEVKAEERDPNLIVGFDKSDDTGVYKLSEELALVQTVDFSTPVANDPLTFWKNSSCKCIK